MIATAPVTYVVGSVHIEAEWDPSDPVAETHWLDTIAPECRHTLVVVAQARLDREDIEDVLRAHAVSPNVRGVRHKPAASLTAHGVKRGGVGSMDDPKWRDGFAHLANYKIVVRPPGTILASRPGRRTGPRFPSHDQNHSQPHWIAWWQGSRKSRPMETRTGIIGFRAQHRGQDLRVRPTQSTLDSGFQLQRGKRYDLYIRCESLYVWKQFSCGPIVCNVQ